MAVRDAFQEVSPVSLMALHVYTAVSAVLKSLTVQKDDINTFFFKRRQFILAIYDEKILKFDKLLNNTLADTTRKATPRDFCLQQTKH